jgi:hypothetical protein
MTPRAEPPDRPAIGIPHATIRSAYNNKRAAFPKAAHGFEQNL